MRYNRGVMQIQNGPLGELCIQLNCLFSFAKLARFAQRFVSRSVLGFADVAGFAGKP